MRLSSSPTYIAPALISDAVASKGISCGDRRSRAARSSVVLPTPCSPTSRSERRGSSPSASTSPRRARHVCRRGRPADRRRAARGSSDLPQELEVDLGSPPLVEVASEVVAEIGLEAVDEELERLDLAGRDVPSEGGNVDDLAPPATLLDEASDRIPVHLVAELREDAAGHGLGLLLDQDPEHERFEVERAARQRPDRV
jgi:hypothetical protein